MTTKKTEPVTITILASGLSVPDEVGEEFSRNRTRLRGEVVTLTPEQVAETYDRNGISWLYQDDEAQLERWGVVRFRIGDHVEAEGIRYIGEDDERITFRLREAETLAARKITDADERRAELNRINGLYGAPDSGQRTIAEY